VSLPIDTTLDVTFASQLSVTKADIIDGTSVRQLGVRRIGFDDAPPWLDEPGLDDEAIIETFTADGDGLTALSESSWLERWRPRAQTMTERVLAACETAGLALGVPAYVTCSITPVALLEGNPHFDDDQFDPTADLSIVAISGQYVGPRVADRAVTLTGSVDRGPLPFDDAHVEAFRTAGAVPMAATDIAIFGQFGQLHAGPANTDMPAGATHRQLMVLRASIDLGRSAKSV